MKIRWAKLKSFMSSFLATLRAKNYLNRPRAGFRGGAVVPAPGLPPTGGLPPNPSIFKTCNSIANPFLKSQIRHWVQASHQGPQASHQLNPALRRAIQTFFRFSMSLDLQSSISRTRRSKALSEASHCSRISRAVSCRMLLLRVLI